MLKVGQIRKNLNPSTPYLQNLTFTPTIVKNEGYEGSPQIFRDFALTLGSNQTFLANTIYYLRVKVERPSREQDLDPSMLPEDVRFSLKLYQSDGGETGKHNREKIQTIQNNIQLPYKVEHTDEKWSQYNFVFVPNDNYKYLCFQIRREGYDYLRQPRNPFILDNIPVIGNDTVDFDSDGDFAIVNNILPRGYKMKKIGIQSRPGSLFVVNREPIILGRSGVYEINNGTNITSVGVVAPNGSDTSNIQDFLLDFGYDNSEED